VASILAGLTDPCGSEPAREGVSPVAASLSDLFPAPPQRFVQRKHRIQRALDLHTVDTISV